MGHDYPELNLALDDIAKQDELYQPTAFWREASQALADEISFNGIHRFRELTGPLGYFVPTYGTPGNCFTPLQCHNLESVLRNNLSGTPKECSALSRFLSGESSAQADWRVLLAADDPAKLPRLHTFSESDVGQPIEHFTFDGRCFSRSALNYLLGLALLKKHLGADVPRTVLEIGGGFGSLCEILSASGIDGLRYIDIDIPPTSYVAQYYLTKVLGEDQVATYAATRDQQVLYIDSLPIASVLCAWQIERLRGEVDLFVNFISFQEMEPPVVANYLKHVSRLGSRWILLRNMREGKRQRTDTYRGVENPIRTESYLEMLPAYELIESNVFPFGFQTVDGFHSEILLLKRVN